MKVVVFGASGKVGRLLVHELLENNYQVTAFVHSHNPFRKNSRLKVVRGNVYDSGHVDKAVKGQDVVMSALGSWGTKKQDVVSAGMNNIINAMKKHRIKRVISLTGIALWKADRPSVSEKFNHSLISFIAPKILKDGEAHIELLSNSGLDWTVIRSPIMTNAKGDNCKNYVLINDLPGLFETVPRVAVVQAMYEQIKSSAFIEQAPVVSLGKYTM